MREGRFMSAKLPISVTIITRNEGARIEGAIRSVLTFASEVVVVDSGSTDQTRDLAQKLGARVEVRAFQGFGQQKNFAQNLTTAPWVLNIDADERVTPELEAELRDFFSKGRDQEISGIYLPRKTWYLDRWVMHGGWYPNYLLRFARKEGSAWTEPHLHEAWGVTGKTDHFQNPLEHYSFPNQRSHIAKNMEYAAHACDGLKAKGRCVSAFDLTFRPFWKFIDGYFLKSGFLDGAAGFFIAIHSAYATFLRYTYLYEQSAPNSDSRQ
jgi:glycosyltransferase involved in cell wall biosynthesis